MTDGDRHQDRARFRIALVSMPWPLFNRPSVQLGALKSFLETAGLGFRVDTFHPYLEVAKLLGQSRYHALSQNIWICEALYGALCFPERIPAQKRLVAAQLRKTRVPGPFDFDAVRAQLADQLHDWSLRIDWSRYQLLGFSVCFSQLLATLAASRAIKARHPGIPVVLGGSICAPAVGVSLQQAFPEFDYLVTGEGELPLLKLCKVLAGDGGDLPDRVQRAGAATAPGPGSGLYAGDKGIDLQATRNGQLADLSSLPVPDYRDYFLELKTHFADGTFIPELPVEFSRGCWWGKCAFCNLNLQWSGYRAKPAERMATEIDTLSARHGSLDFSFTDNVLPVAGAGDFFATMAGQDRDYRFFAEIRVDQRGRRLAAMAAGGLTAAQAGIEALSDSLLRRLGKGATVIDNLALMRDALEMGVALDGNLITEFPGSTAEEVAETLSVLEFAWPFRPLVTAAFFLGHGSPVDNNPASFGIHAVQHPNNRAIFPGPVLAGLTLLVNGWRGDRQRQKKLWQPVVDRVREWGEFHHGRADGRRPLLSFRDGGSFLIIRQERPDKVVLHHRLRGLSRQIYLQCREPKSLTELRKLYPGQAVEGLLAFLDDLVRKKLLFAQADRYLALAVHWNGG